MTVCAVPRVVLAKYYESPWTDDDLTWTQYLQERANALPAGSGGDEQSSYNPYDYKDPSDKPKDLKDGPPFVQPNLELDAEYGVIYPPKIYYDENGVLNKWYKTREHDWTTEPAEQAPNMSLEYKYASMEKTGATLLDVLRGDFHYKNMLKIQRAKEVHPRLLGDLKKSMESGHFEFTWANRTPMDVPPKVVFEFHRPDVPNPPSSFLEYPVCLSCNCASFLYYGSQHYALKEHYMYTPEFRPHALAPVPQTMMSRFHASKRYPKGKRHPGRGLNCRVCKHIVACYVWFKTQNLSVAMHYKSYPTDSPPSKVMNRKEWERLMGFPFELEEIKRRLATRHPVLPKFFQTAFFKDRQQSAQMDQWFKGTWLNFSEPAKMHVLETLVEHPEEIFYLLVRDAMEAPTKLSQASIEKSYDFMSRLVQPENLLEPKGPVYKRPGTRAVVPPEGIPEDFKELPERFKKKKTRPTYKTTYKRVKPSVEERIPRPLEKRKRNIAKRLRPYLTREAIDAVISRYHEKNQIFDDILAETA